MGNTWASTSSNNNVNVSFGTRKTEFNTPTTYETRDKDGNRLVVMNIPGGKGYCPVDLINQGDFEKAAKVAQAAFNARL